MGSCHASSCDQWPRLMLCLLIVYLIQGGALKRYAAHSPHQLISGRGAPRTMVPHATVRGHRAPRRTGPISTEAYCSHSVYRSHIHLGNGMFLSSVWRAI